MGCKYADGGLHAHLPGLPMVPAQKPFQKVMEPLPTASA